MKRFLFGMVALGLVVTAGCTSDPTAEFRTGPARVVASRSFLQLLPGDSVSIIARTLDDQGNTVMPLPEITVGDAAVATTSVDSNFTLNPNAQLSFYVKGVAPGETNVNLVTGTEADSVVGANIQTLVFPVTFVGTAAVNSAGTVDTVTLTTDPLLMEFDTSGTSSALIDGVEVDVVSLTATEMKVIWSAPAAMTGATITVLGALFLGQFPVPELEVVPAVDLTQDNDEPANNSSATPTVIPFGTVWSASVSGSGDPDDYYVTTTPATGDITFSLTFVGDGSLPDIDFAVWDNNTSAFICQGGTLSNPEACTATGLPAGDYLSGVFFWDNTGGPPDPLWIQVLAAPAGA